MIMAHWKAHVNADSKFLYFFNIEANSPLTVEVSGWSEEDAFEPSEKAKGKMLCLSFKGGKKLLGINGTNGWIIEQVTGETEPEKWVGKTLTLRTAVCKGDECIRVDLPTGTRVSGRYPKFKYTDKKA